MSLNVRQFLNNYEFETILPGSGEVIKFKPMTTGQMKKLLLYEGVENSNTLESALDSLISSCVLTKPFDIKKLYLQDRFYLLVQIRIKTKGETYSFSYKCPKCGQTSVNAVNIEDLKVTKKLEELPLLQISDDLSLRLDHITRGDQLAAEYLVSKKKLSSEKEKQAEQITYTYAQAIKSFISPLEEVSDFPIEEKTFFLDNVEQDKYQEIMQWFEDTDFGIDFTFDMKCIHPQCGFSERVSIPTYAFFV